MFNPLDTHLKTLFLQHTHAFVQLHRQTHRDPALQHWQTFMAPVLLKVKSENPKVQCEIIKKKWANVKGMFYHNSRPVEGGAGSACKFPTIHWSIK